MVFVQKESSLIQRRIGCVIHAGKSGRLKDPQRRQAVDGVYEVLP